MIALASLVVSTNATAATPFVDPANFAAVKAAITVTTDAYQGTTRVKAPEIFTARNRFADTLEMNFIHASDKDEMALYVSMITDSRNGSDYRSAASDGQSLKVQLVSRKVRGCSGGGRYLSGSCSYLEGLWIIFDRPRLAEAARTGFAFAVYGDGPRKEFYLPAAYFAAFKEQIDIVAPGAVSP